ncbi:hypothetical protein [Mesorhizobium muleiense]|jgi:hypothetical protein|uniref:hypothetical protein n=1 Tax=Mesorhizobium muleiense TaxID=1004279 RepID=UPI001F1DA921|nr:hypothetical protein [Mesorhizobium muleiense]MCF6109773.1 hypothetical protein [Mesorhizobium muleiense]
MQFSRNCVAEVGTGSGQEAMPHSPTYRSVDGPDDSPRANSVSASGIDLRQPRSGFNYALLRSPYPAAQRDIDADTAVIIQHLVRTLKGALGPIKPLSGSRQFHI